MSDEGFPKWLFHATKGKRIFKDPDQLDKAGSGWCETPAEVGLVPSAPLTPGGMSFARGVEQPKDASVASEQELDEVEARKASRPARLSPPVSPKTPEQVRRATAPKSKR